MGTKEQSTLGVTTANVRTSGAAEGAAMAANNSTAHKNANTVTSSTTTMPIKPTMTTTTTTLTTTSNTANKTSTASVENLPKSSSPPQVIIIPATQASTVATNAAKKIRRAFSMPRNPFRWSRKFKTSSTSTGSSRGGGVIAGGVIAGGVIAGGVLGDDGEGSVGDGGDGGGGGSNLAITNCVGGGRGRVGSIISLNSYEAVVVSPATDGTTAATKTTTTKTQEENGKLQAPDAVMPGSDKVTAKSNDRQVSGGKSTSSGGNRILRRSSLRKFINRIAQQVSSTMSIGAHKQAASSPATGSPVINVSGGGGGGGTPTASDRVPPIGGYQWPPDQTPGVMGLKNHGNTCFMNAVLQCLSHTDILAEYFVLDQYKADLKRRNKLNSRKFGTKGELTEQLANVLKALWTCKNESDHSTSFKAVVDRYGSQFRSSTQHDAQEFLFWLLDKVHEDLNTASKRRYKSVKNTYGRPDEVIAAETLANHIRCNNSFVQAVFQAQFRSSLTCPRCRKQSNTFDPFHCISVQLPQLQQQTTYVTVVYMRQHPRQVKLGLTVPAGSPIVALRERIQADTGISRESMVLVDITKEGFSRVFYDTQPVATLKGLETIYCIEVPTSSSAASSSEEAVKKLGENNATAAPVASNATNGQGKGGAIAVTADTDLLLLVACGRRTPNKDLPQDVKVGGQGENSAPIGNGGTSSSVAATERFGAPFSMQAPRDCSYADLQKRILREMAPLLKPEVFAYATSPSEMFQIRLQDPSADPDTYLEPVEHPLLTEMIDLALSVLSAEAGPPHVKLLLEWSEPERYFVDLSDTVVEHESVARLQEQSKSNSSNTAPLSLEQCLEHYTKAETLSAEDAWRCPHCQQYLPVVKTLGLWSLPDILVVHFKRFRQHHEKGPNAAKLTTMVKFPLNAFDMSPHLARGLNGGEEGNGGGGEGPTFGSSASTTPEGFLSASSLAYRPSQWKKSRSSDSRSSTLSSRDNRETRYDLYAVCYHQGDTLETGHYTAACKNPYDRQWYKFDDQRVNKVPNENIEQEIINNEAYMLFYQRRLADAEHSGSSSNSGDHWVSKIAPPPSSATSVNDAVTGGEKAIEAAASVTVTAKAEEDKPPDVIEKRTIEPPNVADTVTPDGAKPRDAMSPIESPTIQTTDEKSLVAAEEEIDFADADADAVTNAVHGAIDEDLDDLRALETLGPKEEDEEEEDSSNRIFIMDEEAEDEQVNVAVKTAEDAKDIPISPKKTLRPPLLAGTGHERSSSFAGGADAVAISNEKPRPLTNGTKTPSPLPRAAAATATSAISSSSTSLTPHSSPHSLEISALGAPSALQTKFNGFSTHQQLHAQQKETPLVLSSSLKSTSSGGILASNGHDFHLSYQWNGSRSSVSAVENATQQQSQQQPGQRHTTHCLNLRHSFSTSSNYKLRECNETLSSLLRNSANTCSKDTLLFIDQPNGHHHHHGHGHGHNHSGHHHHHHHNHHHSLMEDEDDTFMGSRSLWISPVTPHKLITVSPKN